MVDEQDPVPAHVLELIEIFETHLPDVSFPGVDHDTLERQSLAVRSRASELHGAREQLEQARASLEGAEVAHAQARAELLSTSHRALGYARVFAEEHPDLRERLERLAKDAAPAGAAPVAHARRRRKGRARDGGELPFGATR